jgi:hypothetical protein
VRHQRGETRYAQASPLRAASQVLDRPGHQRPIQRREALSGGAGPNPTEDVGFGALHTDNTRDFSIEIDDPEKPEKITVSFYRHGSADLSALPTSSQAYAELMSSLPGYGLKFTGSTAGNISKIAVKPYVPVEFRLVADIPGAAIRIFLRNVEDLGVFHYAFNPEDVDVKFMAAIDALLLHQPGDFYRIADKALGDGPTEL